MVNRTKNKPKKKKNQKGEYQPFLEVGAVQGYQCSFGGRISAVPNKSQRDYHTRLVQ